MESIRKAVRGLQKFVNRPWYYPVVGVLAGLDLFILVVPTDALLISSVMLKPRKWVSAFFWIALGAAIGALTLGALIQWDATRVTEVWFPSIFHSSTWDRMDQFFDRHGDVALLLIAL